MPRKQQVAPERTMTRRETEKITELEHRIQSLEQTVENKDKKIQELKDRLSELSEKEKEFRSAEFLGLEDATGVSGPEAVTVVEAAKALIAATNNLRNSSRWQSGNGSLSHAGQQILIGAMAALNQVGLFKLAGYNSSGPWPKKVNDVLGDRRPDIAKELSVVATV